MQAYSQESFLVLLGVRPAERSSLAFLEAGGCLVHPLLLAGDSDCSGGPSSYCVSCVSPVGGTLCPSLSIFHLAKSTVFTHNWVSYFSEIVGITERVIFKVYQDFPGNNGLDILGTASTVLLDVCGLYSYVLILSPDNRPMGLLVPCPYRLQDFLQALILK